MNAFTDQYDKCMNMIMGVAGSKSPVRLPFRVPTFEISHNGLLCLM